MRGATDTYDLIVLDLTDPGGASEPLYGAEFYRACAARLNPTGAMTLHIASPVAHPERVRAGDGQSARGLSQSSCRISFPYRSTAGFG